MPAIPPPHTHNPLTFTTASAPPKRCVPLPRRFLRRMGGLRDLILVAACPSAHAAGFGGYIVPPSFMVRCTDAGAAAASTPLCTSRRAGCRAPDARHLTRLRDAGNIISSFSAVPALCKPQLSVSTLSGILSDGVYHRQQAWAWRQPRAMGTLSLLSNNLFTN